MNKDRLYRTDEGLSKIKTLLLQLNNRRTDFTYPSTHTIRILLVVGFLELSRFIKQICILAIFLNLTKLRAL